MNNWNKYNKSDFKHLDKNIEVKMNSGKIYSISMVVGVSVFTNTSMMINTDNILFWRNKKDWNRYNTLQKHYQLLNEYDFEKLDNLEFAINDSLYEEEDKEKVRKLFKKLNGYIESAQNIIEIESKQYL